jgi:hypothetical protein
MPRAEVQLVHLATLGSSLPLLRIGEMRDIPRRRDDFGLPSPLELELPLCGRRNTN